MLFLTEKKAQQVAINYFYDTLERCELEGKIIIKYGTYYGELTSPHGNVDSNMIFSIDSAYTAYRANRNNAEREIYYNAVIDVYNVVSKFVFYDEDREWSYEKSNQLMELANNIFN